ncbi:hypothetical protein GCM10023219_10770 [Stakelama sediminis]|uniref:Uncharacterized protein n=1 Tax=Stakelama sediminis TaxID=463200 RepID=A0A840YVR9_9SPHN|nr:hypothetical protein [Stakelama sediminis]MBB5717801.1 hypothetical protein [Stakelama sediminis]
MRGLLVLIGLAIIIFIILVSVGWINITQTRPAQAPAYQMETGTVDVGTVNKTISVPTISAHKPADNQAVTNQQ